LLARTVVELINGENDRFHAGEFLDSVARRSVSVVGGAAAGVMLNEPPANIRPAAASNLQIRRLQALEVPSQEGPSVEAIRSRAPVNVRTDQSLRRWPAFGAHAVAEGYQVVSALPMRSGEMTVGALKLVRTERRRLARGEMQIA
jgi:hypothetical protein